MSKEEKQTAQFSPGARVRVWWPPTQDEDKTDFSGMYWPVRVIQAESKGTYKVQYDNGETEVVKAEHIHPISAPVDFGREGVPLQVGEFVEVFNGSKEDPAEWLAKVTAVLNDEKYLVNYPFHDEPNEVILIEKLRRARLYDRDRKMWVIIKPGQIWSDGDVESPVELETVTPKELAVYLQQADGAGFPNEKVPTNRVKGGGVSKKSKSPSKTLNGGSAKRKGKPERAKG